MRHPSTLPAVIVAALLSLPAPAAAQGCEAWFPFDGSLADASGNGFDGDMIAAEGETPTPRFVEGRNGQALELSGTSAMRAFIDLHRDRCPKVTISAWLLVDPTVSGTRFVVSSGNPQSPGFRISGGTLTANGPANGMSESDVFRPRAGWTFVAAVYDVEAGRYRLHWRTRSSEKPLPERWREPEDALWVGAMLDRLSHPAAGVVIDDLRITGRALNAEQLRALQQRDAGASPASAMTASAPGEWQGASCNEHIDCGAGSYCGVDNLCHPDRHAPRTAGSSVPPLGAGLAGPVTANDPAAGLTVPADQPGTGIGESLEFGRTHGEPAATGESATTGAGYRFSEETQEAIAERVSENRPPELAYESEEAAEEAQRERERRAAEAEAEAEAEAADSASGSSGGSTIRLGTDERLSNVSGRSGEITERADLDFAPINRIMLWEMADKPCLLKVRNGDMESAIIRCGATPALNLPKRIWRDGRWGVTRLRVGLNNPALAINDRVKGIWAEWTQFDDAGGLSDTRESDSFKQVNFGEWEQIVSCPADHVATGLVGQFFPGRFPTQNTDRLVGLRLICREVLSGN